MWVIGCMTTIPRGFLGVVAGGLDFLRTVMRMWRRRALVGVGMIVFPVIGRWTSDLAGEQGARVGLLGAGVFPVGWAVVAGVEFWG